MRALAIALVALCGCTPPRKDSVHPVVCGAEVAADVAEPSDHDLRRAAAEAPYVVRGRVRFAGTAVARRGQQQRSYVYVIVDALDFLRGDPWQIHPRYRRSFPLLEVEVPSDGDGVAEPRVLGSLRCREEEVYYFFIAPPTTDSQSGPAPPAPVQRSFGAFHVQLLSIVPERAAARVEAAVGGAQAAQP
ncbi:MAG: hypothetical protein KF718_28285 [Polyangiaceae bacterium]|nr:hypothetical protein [Polyangiaceae bacterium]